MTASQPIPSLTQVDLIEPAPPRCPCWLQHETAAHPLLCHPALHTGLLLWDVHRHRVRTQQNMAVTMWAPSPPQWAADLRAAFPHLPTAFHRPTFARKVRAAVWQHMDKEGSVRTAKAALGFAWWDKKLEPPLWGTSQHLPGAPHFSSHCNFRSTKEQQCQYLEGMGRKLL